MRYEVLERYEDNGGENLNKLKDGTPLRIRIHPEDTPVRDMLVAIVVAGYDMGGFNSLEPANPLCATSAVHSASSLTAKKALQYLLFDEADQRGWFQRFRGVPDTRVPNWAGANHIYGRPVRLMVTASTEVPGAFDMETAIYEKEIGAITDLMGRTQGAIPRVQGELKPRTLRERLSWRR